MKATKNILSLILAIILVISIFPLTIFAEDDTIEINSLDDYYKLATYSKSSLYTKDKSYILKTDLDFTNKEFEPIGIFDGIFDGKNHTIKGVDVSAAKSGFGIFREIGVDGCVKNLNVEISLTSASIGENIGGLAGTNNGQILNVNVKGYIKGIKNIGGIAGVNNGDITCSSFDGTILGEHMIGGIAGYSQGTIKQCKSYGQINCEYIDVTTYEVSIISYLPKQIAKLLLPEEIVGVTDVGGIAGYSQGNIIECENNSNVGYLNIGSNIGGIVGRSNKLVSGCTNNGNICGKNDIGGIVGQIIPYTHWNLSESKLELISKNLETLHTNTDSMLEKVDKYSSNLSNDVKDITKQIDIVEKNLDAFLTSGEEWIDSSVYNINEISERVSTVIDILASTSQNMDNVAKHITKSLDNISDAHTHANELIEYYDEKTETLLRLVDNIKTNIENVSALTQKYVDIYNNGLESIQTIKDTETLYKNLGQSLKTAYTIVKTLYDASASLNDFINNNKMVLGLVMAGLLLTLNDTLDKTCKNIEKILDLGVDSIQIEISTVIEINEMIKSIVPILVSIEEEINVMEQSSIYASGVLKSVAGAAHELSLAITDLGSVVISIDSIFPYLSNQGTIRFDYIKTYVSSTQSDFFDSLEVLNEKFNHLATEVDDKELKDNINEVSDSFFELTKNIVNALNDLKKIQYKTIVEEIDYTKDNLDEDFAFVYSCTNTGEISGETNIGGICGIINLDVDNVSEALNLEGLLVSGSKYIISATIQESNNYSKVTASKDYAGGIVGNQKYGLIIDSLSESYVKTNGNYAGGIAGYSDTSIKNSKSRSSISGNSYLGGIVGKGKNIENNASVCDIVSAIEYVGSIAGYCDGTIIENLYGVYYNGGINGFDYEDKAIYDESLDFVDKHEMEKEVTVVFVTENEKISYKIPYNTKLTTIPTVENKGDLYWYWNDLPSESVKCDTTIYGEYKKPKTTISTGEKIPSVLVEGQFYNENVLYVENINDEKYPTSVDGSFLKKISVSSYDGKIKVRCRADANGKLYSIDNTGVKKLDYTREGSYIVFETENDSLVYYKTSETNFTLIVIISITSLLLLAGIVICIIVLVKHNKKKKQETSVEDTVESDSENNQN